MSFLRNRKSSEHYKWGVLSCTSLGMLLATVNSGTLIIALPDLERELHTTLLQLVWVILVYMIVSTVLVLALSKGGLTGWSNWLVIGGLAAAVVLLPLFVLIERRGRAPMLDLGLFRNRLFAAASAAAFLNGLSRFALMFLFVFYFQGPQGQSPIMAGLELAPMAIGMLIASPLAGMYADRRGSRGLAAAGVVVSALGLAGMTTLVTDSPFWLSALWLLL